MKTKSKSWLKNKTKEYIAMNKCREKMTTIVSLERKIKNTVSNIIHFSDTQIAFNLCKH